MVDIIILFREDWRLDQSVHVSRKTQNVSHKAEKFRKSRHVSKCQQMRGSLQLIAYSTPFGLQYKPRVVTVVDAPVKKSEMHCGHYAQKGGFSETVSASKLVED